MTRKWLGPFFTIALTVGQAGATTIISVSPNPVRINQQLILTGTGMSAVLAVYFPPEAPGSLTPAMTQTGFDVIDDQHVNVFVPHDAIAGSVRIDANFQPGLTAPPVQIKTDNDFTGDGRADFLFENAG